LEELYWKVIFKMAKNKKTRNGQPADIVTLTFHDWYGNKIDKVKGKTTEKNKGVVMLKKIRDQFAIDNIDISEFEYAELEEQKKMFDNSVKWTRDEKGNIISPFDSNTKNKDTFK